MIHAEFETTDIVLAAVLKVKMCELMNIVRNGNTNIGTFVFSNVDDKLLNEFNLGKSLVEPITFNNTIKQLTTSVRRMVD
jgi:hypothetical protein